MENCLLLIGIVTAAAGGFFLASVLLGAGAFCAYYTAQFFLKKLTQAYHLIVIMYWLARLEKEGTHCFEKKQ